MTKISDVLWRAANEELGDWPYDFSCRAVLRAEGLDDEWLKYGGPASFYEWCSEHSETIRFLHRLGLPEDDQYPFSHLRYEDKQGARYAWLMFASMYAEEIGL